MKAKNRNKKSKLSKLLSLEQRRALKNRPGGRKYGHLPENRRR